jgi:D-alanyl-D-alanine carboxypeptidase/D-alanyl-D-alanine-endopeptidase (penicillin-binding protein 4)
MRKGAVVPLAVAVALLGASPAYGRAPWRRRIDRLVAGRPIGVSVWRARAPVYEHRATHRRVPASNQKLLTSMALLDWLGPGRRLPTIAAAHALRSGVVAGNLWILGRGDPAVATSGPFARTLPFTATRIRRLALRIVGAGVRMVNGSIMGSTGYFRRDWDAPGWRAEFRSRDVALPTALTLDGNSRRGRHIIDPERRLAARFTKRLRSLGVIVEGTPGAGRPRRSLSPVARVWSRPLRILLGYMNRQSSNFFAEVLGKRLAVARSGRPGSIAGAARAIAAWAARHGVKVVARDASGLSSRNRVSPRGMVRLLRASGDAAWGQTLRRSLASAGEGTLEDRLAGVGVRAKTGTLVGVSSLSGWVWLRSRRAWAEFSIMSRGLPKYRAVAIEDLIVRILARSGRPRLRSMASPASDPLPGLTRALSLTALLAPGLVAGVAGRARPDRGAEAGGARPDRGAEARRDALASAGPA